MGIGFNASWFVGDPALLRGLAELAPGQVPQRWDGYIDPATGRRWWWCEATQNLVWDDHIWVRERMLVWVGAAIPVAHAARPLPRGPRVPRAPQGWETYTDPATGRGWWWCEATQIAVWDD